MVKLAVRDTNGEQWQLDGATAVNNVTYAEGHDFYSEDSGNRFKSEWDEMVGQYRGIDQACEKFNDALKQNQSRFRRPPQVVQISTSLLHLTGREPSQKFSMILDVPFRNTTITSNNSLNHLTILSSRN